MQSIQLNDEEVKPEPQKQNGFINLPYYAGLPIKVKWNGYIFVGTEKKMNDNELTNYFKDYCPVAYQTFKEGCSMYKKGNLAASIGSLFSLGGIVGMICSSDNDMLFYISSGVTIGGAIRF